MKKSRIGTFLLAGAMLLTACSCSDTTGTGSGSSQAGNGTVQPVSAKNGYYRIASRASGKYIDSKGYTADGASIPVTEKSEKSTQYWMITSHEDGTVRILAYGTENYLGAADGKAVQLTAEDVSCAWKMLEGEEGSVAFQNNETGKLLSTLGKDSDNTTLAASADQQTQNEEFKLEKVVAFNSLAATYVSNQAAGKVLSVPGLAYDTKVESAVAEDKYQNEWFIWQDEDDPSLFRLKSIYSSKYLKAGSDGSLTVTGFADDKSQLWKIEESGDSWKITNAGSGGLLTMDSSGRASCAAAGDAAAQTWELPWVNPDYPVPEPKPVDTGRAIITAETCPLWGKNEILDYWENMQPYPEKMPLMGYYSEGTKPSIDWEIKIAVENGISVFMPCWFRAKDSLDKKEVRGLFDQFIEGIQNAKYKDMIKYCLLWENTNPVGGKGAGSSGLQDFKENLVPYFINEHFKQSNYFLFDNAPVFEIISMDENADGSMGNFIQDMGGVEQAKEAIEYFRSEVKKAGFRDLIILSNFNGYSSNQPTVNPSNHKNEVAKNVGADYSISYHWPTFSNLWMGGKDADTLISTIKSCWDGQKSASLIPNVITCSMGWDDRPWGGAAMAWRLEPNDFKALLSEAKKEIESRPEDRLDGRMINLDNWNEFGEGHYISPTEEYGFGYMDAIREVFS